MRDSLESHNHRTLLHLMPENCHSKVSSVSWYSDSQNMIKRKIMKLIALSYVAIVGGRKE